MIDHSISCAGSLPCSYYFCYIPGGSLVPGYNSNLIIGTQARGAETCVNLLFTLNESSELPGVCSPGKIGSSSASAQVIFWSVSLVLIGNSTPRLVLLQGSAQSAIGMTACNKVETMRERLAVDLTMHVCRRI